MSLVREDPITFHLLFSGWSVSDPRGCPEQSSLCEDVTQVSCEEIPCSPLTSQVDSSVIDYAYEGCFSSPVAPKFTALADLDPDNPSDDPDIWDSAHKGARFTVELCGRLCSMRGDYAYIGLWKGECFCKAEPPAALSAPIDKAECGTPCPGDDNQMCGGDLALSIYNLALGDKQLYGNSYKLSCADKSHFFKKGDTFLDNTQIELTCGLKYV